MNKESEQLDLNDNKISRQSSPTHLFGFNWLVQWACLLVTVFLMSSGLNCLFQWLAYGHAWDLSGSILSFVLAALVYFGAFNNKKIASYKRRLVITVTAMASWAIFLPIIMKITGFK